MRKTYKVFFNGRCSICQYPHRRGHIKFYECDGFYSGKKPANDNCEPETLEEYVSPNSIFGTGNNRIMEWPCDECLPGRDHRRFMAWLGDDEDFTFIVDRVLARAERISTSTMGNGGVEQYEENSVGSPSSSSSHSSLPISED